MGIGDACVPKGHKSVTAKLPEQLWPDLYMGVYVILGNKQDHDAMAIWRAAHLINRNEFRIEGRVFKRVDREQRKHERKQKRQQEREERRQKKTTRKRRKKTKKTTRKRRKKT